MKKKKNHTFPIIISVVSLLTIFKIILYPLDIFSIAAVAVGIAGIALYYSGNRIYDAFFYAWVFLQLPNIFMESNTGAEMPIMNAFPNSIINININMGLNLGLQGGRTLMISFNFLAIGLYYLLKYINAEKPIGSTVSISRFSKGTFPQIEFPVKGIIEKIVGRKKMVAVYLVQLDREIMIRDKMYISVLLEPKDNSLIQLTDKKQICGLKTGEQKGPAYHERDHAFIDWVMIEAK